MAFGESTKQLVFVLVGHNICLVLFGQNLSVSTYSIYRMVMYKTQEIIMFLIQLLSKQLFRYC